jgi:hypothetical protein
MSDPTAGFTDMQWYLYRQRNIAFFAAYTAHPFNEADLLQAARTLLSLAPQLNFGFSAGVPENVLLRTISSTNVSSLEGFPDRWLDRGEAVLSNPALPLFRLRYAALAAPDRAGRAGFLLVQVSHALVEGADSALLSRSQSADHPVSLSPRRTSPLVKASAAGLGAVLAGLHLMAGNFITVRPGPFQAATRAYPRAVFSQLARRYGVRQRALLYGLALATLFDAGTEGGKRRISTTYSSIDDGGGADRDAFMRMRMRFAIFENRTGLEEFVRGVDARLSAAEARESGFNAEMNAEGIRMHRRLSRLIPGAYQPRLFHFMPYDMVLGLIPPHRLGGRLTAGLLEPVYAGAALEGANACVIVPGRTELTFNFYIQQRLLAKVSRLDELLAPLLMPRS